MSEICRNCHVYRLFKEKCWYYWEGKRECSKFQKSPEELPRFCSADSLENRQE